jgi:hypothetical protein
MRLILVGIASADTDLMSTSPNQTQRTQSSTGSTHVTDPMG